jgi:hypothetical protein
VLLRQPCELVDRLALALRPPTAASNGTSAKLLCFGVCQIELADALTSVGKGDANRRTLPVRDFVAGLVGYANCLFRHRSAPSCSTLVLETGEILYKKKISTKSCAYKRGKKWFAM